MLAVPSEMTAVAGAILTAAQWNSNVRDGVNFLANTPLFMGLQSATQTVANNAFVPVSIDVSVIDTYGGHSTTTNNSRYISQLAGYYQVFARSTFTGNSTGRRIGGIFLNGSAYRNSENDPIGTNVKTISVSDFVFLNVGDYIESQVFQTSGAGLALTNSTGYTSSLSARWVHA
jgi:hypothetical protein